MTWDGKTSRKDRKRSTARRREREWWDMYAKAMRKAIAKAAERYIRTEIVCGPIIRNIVEGVLGTPRKDDVAMTKRLIVFEETGEIRQAKPGEPTLGELDAVHVFDDFSSRNEVILRRLTDAEVAALCAPANSAAKECAKIAESFNVAFAPSAAVKAVRDIAAEIRRRFGVKM